MTQKGIAETGYMTTKVSSELCSLVRISQEREQSGVCYLDALGSGDQSDWEKYKTNIN